MTDKTEEQIARDKAAIEAMRNAKSNMGVALDRISTLERALDTAIDGLRWTKQHVGTGSYVYSNNSAVRVADAIEERIAAAQKALG